MSADISDSVFCAGMACAKDLPDISYIKNAYGKDKTPIEAFRRPEIYEIEVYSFPQCWGSTALGFGGIGGQAMSSAQTTVVISGYSAAIYFGKGLAYVIPKFNSAMMADIASQNIAACGKQGKYKAI
jgi:hypothetical protein